VSYGSVGGARAVEQLRLIAIELQMAPVRHAVHIQPPFFLELMRGEKKLHDFEHLNQSARMTLDQLAWWTHALKAARDKTETRAAA
jgi:NAD(P)H-dependent FMN reductase